MHQAAAAYAHDLSARIRQQTIRLFPDHGIALTTKLFQLGPVEDRDLAAAIGNRPELLQLAGGFGHAFTAHTSDKVADPASDGDCTRRSAPFA